MITVITFAYGFVVCSGVEYPINPLDLTMPYTNSNNELICLGTFHSQSNTTTGGVDAALGDTFLRNVYAVFNYGHWTQPGTGQPYVQLLSVGHLIGLTSSHLTDLGLTDTGSGGCS